MENTKAKICAVSLSDTEELLEIYAPYVEHTAISFEYDVPSVEEFAERIKTRRDTYPYLVARDSERLLGYAYTSPFVGRAAYAWSAQTTIYLREECRNRGIGRALYEALEKVCAAQNILNLNACIGFPEKEDEYLTKNSVEFHSHMGYQTVGLFHNSGYKFGRWYHMVWMEKMIGEHSEKPKRVMPFRELNDGILEKCGVSRRGSRHHLYL